MTLVTNMKDHYTVNILVGLVWLVLHSQSFGGKPLMVPGRSVGGDLATSVLVGRAETTHAAARNLMKMLVRCILFADGVSSDERSRVFEARCKLEEVLLLVLLFCCGEKGPS